MIRRLMLAAALVGAPAVVLAQPVGHPAHAQQQDTSKGKKPTTKKHKTAAKPAAKPAPKDTTKK